MRSSTGAVEVPDEPVEGPRKSRLEQIDCLLLLRFLLSGGDDRASGSRRELDVRICPHAALAEVVEVLSLPDVLADVAVAEHVAPHVGEVEVANPLLVDGRASRDVVVEVAEDPVPCSWGDPPLARVGCLELHLHPKGTSPGAEGEVCVLPSVALGSQERPHRLPEVVMQVSEERLVGVCTCGRVSVTIVARCLVVAGGEASRLSAVPLLRNQEPVPPEASVAPVVQLLLEDATELRRRPPVGRE